MKKEGRSRKKVSAMLAGVVAMSAVLALSACGGGGETAQVNSGEGGTTLTYWVQLDSVLATMVQSYNDVAMYQQREKDSGIHIDFIHPASGQATEQFNLLLASGSMPDIVEFNWNVYAGGPQQALENNVIISLDEYMDHAPNYKKALTESELADAYRKASTLDDGQIFAFMPLNIGNYRVFSGPVIRRDWLEELGLKVPETIDDWTNVLTAFKEKKGATVPLTSVGIPKDFAGAFDVGQDLYIEDGKVMYGPLQDGYKEYMDTLHQWYEKGLLDRDIATNQRTLVDAKITDGSAGALTGCYIGSYMGRYLKQKETEDPAYDLAAAPYPVRTRGEINRFATAEAEVPNYKSAVITTACKNPETAIEWMDYWYSDEGYYMVNFGVEGVSYNMVDGKPVYTDLILHNPDGLSINEALLLNCRSTAPAPGFKQAPECLEQYYEYPQQTEAMKLWEVNTESQRRTRIPDLNATSEEADKLASIQVELETYVDEMRWNFITGKEPIENYDKFVKNLKSNFRVDEYLSILQEQYARYLKK